MRARTAGFAWRLGARLHASLFLSPLVRGVRQSRRRETRLGVVWQVMLPSVVLNVVGKAAQHVPVELPSTVHPGSWGVDTIDILVVVARSSCVGGGDERRWPTLILYLFSYAYLRSPVYEKRKGRVRFSTVLYHMRMHGALLCMHRSFLSLPSR